MAEDNPKFLEPRYRGLRPIQKGEVRNPHGRNGRLRLTELREYLSGKAEPTSQHTRRENIILALYATAIDRRRRDHIAAARVLLAYDLGLPAQALQVDHSSEDGSMAPALVRIHVVKPKEDGTDETTPVELGATDDEGDGS